VEAGPRVLSAFPDSLAATARRSLTRLGVEVMTGKAVEKCDAGGVIVAGERISSRTVIWAAGVAASPAGKWLDAPRDRAGRIEVEPHLSVSGLPNVFAIGDTALVLDAAGHPVPGIATAAKQEGKYVAALIERAVAGKSPGPPFRYRHLGNLATIGRKSAVVDFGFVRLSGFFAWVLWSVAHVYFLIGFRNRLVVALDWIWAYVTFQRGARLITGDTSD
jgi:NADH dehydrogenase